MRTKLIAIAFVAACLPGFSQTIKGTVKLRGTRLTYPLVRTWIREFKKQYPDIDVTISPQAPKDSIDFNIASYAVGEKELQENREAVVVTRYVQLLVVNSKRPDLAQLQAHGVTEEVLRNLFFTPQEPAFANFSKSETPLALYVRDRPVCAVKAFATHFGTDPAVINGVGIKGDDEELADAVRQDVNGICFNNLGFIYDVQTRKVSDNLAVVPQDLNDNGIIDNDENIYGNLDSVIAFIEKTNHPKFVNERVNFLFNKSNENVCAGLFLNWILTEGQSFNNRLGFIDQDRSFLIAQQEIARKTFVSVSHPGNNSLKKSVGSSRAGN
ncbi:MAG TPA: hypothetical protein VK666_19100 [Chryseolinea sp.]|nr:hypothetical protein [Chryseolinea sp.]